jgi:predicted TIM-barrel fold metal-dependent hydrolase
MMDWFGEDNFMWSSDYPHAASTWPHSRQVIADELGHLPKPVIDKVVRQNVLDLYTSRSTGLITNR